MGKKKTNYIRTLIWTVVLAAMLFLVGYISFPLYDRQEASDARGTVYPLDDSWSVTYADGTQEQRDLPLTVDGTQSNITLEHTISSDYSGLALALQTKNAAVRVFVNGKPVYEAGHMQSGRRSGDESRAESVTDGQTDGNVPPPNQSTGDALPPSGAIDHAEMPAASEESVSRTEASNNLIDLPNLSQDTAVKIILEPVNEKQSVNILSASVAKRDAAVINQMRSSIYPMACILIILISVAAMIMMGITRMIYGGERRGIFRLILFTGNVIIYCAVNSGLFATFIGNGRFFGTFEEMCFLTMPVLLNFYFEKEVSVRHPRRMNVLFGFSAAVALLALLMHASGISGNLAVAAVLSTPMAISLAVILLTVIERNRTNGQSYFEMAGLAFLTVAAIIVPIRQFSRQPSSVMGTLIVSAFTLFFVFMTAQEISDGLRAYQDKANETARALEKQNEQLLKATEEAEEARQEAILANEAKGKFLANMSHEIRTPINAVLGMDEMILRESREENVRGYAADIFTAGQTLLSLINDILDFSKIESGKMEIVPVEYDMSSLIHDLSNMITQRAKAKDLAFEVSVDSAIPARFYGDDVRIRQVLTNILTNSVKYTNEGSIWFRVTGKRCGEDELLRFEVQDTGIGMKEEDLPKLFAAYERIEESRNRNIEGTGLGMNITMQLLHMMGGTMDVKSVYGEGSTFIVELKQKILDETPLGDFSERIRSLQDNYSYTEAFRAPDARILVVDDNSMNRKVFVSFLKLTEIQIDEAAGGRESIELAEKNKYDIIFMDHMMPEMDGVEAMHRIKASSGASKDTPIIVLTANAVVGAREEYLKEGFDGFLSKPIAAKKLEETIRTTLDPSLLLPAKEQQKAAAQTGGEVPDDLPVVDGLDWAYAYLHLPGTELLSSSVREFYRVLPNHAEKLQGFYDALPDSGALDAYRIEVHAMKSMAATIGIVPLAGMAKMLEYAAREENEAVIRSLHGVFIEEWLSYKEKLKGVFGIGEEENAEKEAADPKIVKALLEMLQTAMDDFDVDAADDAMAKLMQFDYDEDTLGKLEKMQSAVADLDNELVEELAQDISDGIGQGVTMG